MSYTSNFGLAVAQMTVHPDPGDVATLKDSGRQIRQLMREAHRSGARLIQFPEGATCSPHKAVMSVHGPEKLGPADWGRANKITSMYTPGSAPVTFDVDGLRFGCALGMEATYPEVFLEYERLDVDCVPVSTHGPGIEINNGPFALQARAHAAANSYWVSYSGTAQDAVNAPSGVISPDGEWLDRCPRETTPAVVVVDLDGSSENLARPWRRNARTGIYDPHLLPGDPQSLNRAAF